MKPLLNIFIYNIFHVVQQLIRLTSLSSSPSPMSRSPILLFSIFLVLFSSSPAQSQPFVSLSISSNGLSFAKDILISKAISSLTPLTLPKIQNFIKIPFLGNVHVSLSNITIYKVSVLGSVVKPGETGVVIVADGGSCDLSMNWFYEYIIGWIFPVRISDRGRASVKVEGMEVGITLGLDNTDGTLKLALLDCGCYVKDILIDLDGGASWFYQGLINAFEEQIGSAVENAISKKLGEGIFKLDSLLQSLPKEIPVDDIASVNVTFVDQPSLSNSSVGFKIDGLFTAKEKVSFTNTNSKAVQPLASCSDPSKMLGISLDEAVFNSASVLYFDSDYMKWIVDKIPDQSLLNTAGWRFIIPQLYKKYPNDDMNLNITLSSPPVMKISQEKIDGIVFADLIIDVLTAERVVPVVCISLVTPTFKEIHASGSVRISGNNLAGNLRLNDFTMSLKWSKVGNLHMFLIQPVVWTLLETVALPYANSHLQKGFPLPIIHGFTLQNAKTVFSNSSVVVCSDVTYAESDNVNQLPYLS